MLSGADTDTITVKLIWSDTLLKYKQKSPHFKYLIKLFQRRVDKSHTNTPIIEEMKKKFTWV